MIGSQKDILFGGGYMKILIIIPAYNEEGNIGSLLDRMLNIESPKFDILVINDSSTDDTSFIARNYGVKVIDLPCNLGIGGAVQTGYQYAFKNNYDIAIQVDGDGQHRPEYIIDLIQPIINGDADLVSGSRYINKIGFQSTQLRRIGISYFSKIIELIIKQKITDPTSGFRACNSKVVRLFSQKYPNDYPEPESLVSLGRNEYRIKEIPVIMDERRGGISSINVTRSIYYMIKVSLAILIDTLRKRAL